MTELEVKKAIDLMLAYKWTCSTASKTMQRYTKSDCSITILTDRQGSVIYYSDDSIKHIVRGLLKLLAVLDQHEEKYFD